MKPFLRRETTSTSLLVKRGTKKPRLWRWEETTGFYKVTQAAPSSSTPRLRPGRQAELLADHAATVAALPVRAGQHPRRHVGHAVIEHATPPPRPAGQAASRPRSSLAQAAPLQWLRSPSAPPPRLSRCACR
jgi:hypothetical protein